MLSKAVPVFKNLRLTVRRPGFANDTAEAARRPARRCSSAPRRAFPHSEEAIADFQPNLNFVRAYTPDIFNGFAKLGQITGYYDGNGHYARVQLADLNLFNYNSGSGELEPIPPSEQYDALRLLGRPSSAAAPAAPPSPPPTAPAPSSNRPSPAPA